jgi:YD repeat-containing protein
VGHPPNYETTYTYSSAGYGDGCGTIFPFPTQIKDIGTGMSTNYAYDCTGGVMTAAQNYNGTSSQVDYGYTTSPGTGAIADPFWRLMSTTDPLGSAVWNNYPTGASPDQSSTLFKYNSNNSENETFYDTDGYGRLTSTYTKQGPASTNYDTANQAYSWPNNYRETQTSQPCSTAAGGSCTLVHTFYYDPLGRLHEEKTTSNETINHVYDQNDDATVVTNGPTVQTEYDGLGRVTYVCHAGTTANTGSGTACANTTNMSYNGATDAYQYASNPGTTAVSVKRNGIQERVLSYDALGRLTQKTTPEGGTWNYYYDNASANCAGTTAHRGKLICTKDPNGNQTIYFYDGLGRITDVGSGLGGSSLCMRFRYDNTSGYNGSIPTGIFEANNKGRLTEAETDSCGAPSTMYTDEWFAYDVDGRVTDMWEGTSHSNAVLPQRGDIL